MEGREGTEKGWDMMEFDRLGGNEKGWDGRGWNKRELDRLGGNGI